MTWQRKVTGALARHAGIRIERVSKAGEPERAAGQPKKAAHTPFRPPADPRLDRLLKAPVFVISPVRLGSTLLRPREEGANPRTPEQLQHLVAESRPLELIEADDHAVLSQVLRAPTPTSPR